MFCRSENRRHPGKSVNINVCPASNVHICNANRSAIADHGIDICSSQDLHILGEVEGQATKVVLAFQAYQMLNVVELIVINKNVELRRIIQPDVISLAPNHITETDSNCRLDSHIPIAFFMKAGRCESNVIIIHPSYQEAKSPLKAIWSRRYCRCAGLH